MTVLIHKTPPFFAKCLLLPSQPEFLLLLLCILLVCRQGELAYKTLLFVACCVVVNVALKVTFQVPSHMTHAKGHFAFPSGHMQFSTVFYGWITYYLHKNSFQQRKSAGHAWGAIDNLKIYLLYSLLMLVLSSVGYGLVIAGYHSAIDVVGGWVVGTLLVSSFGWIEIKIPRYVPLLVACIVTICMVYIPFQYLPVPKHAWRSYQIVIMLSVLFYIPYRRLFCQKQR